MQPRYLMLRTASKTSGSSHTGSTSPAASVVGSAVEITSGAEISSPFASTTPDTASSFTTIARHPCAGADRRHRAAARSPRLHRRTRPARRATTAARAPSPPARRRDRCSSTNVVPPERGPCRMSRTPPAPIAALSESALELVVEQILHRHRHDAQQLGHVRAAQRAELSAESEHRREVAERRRVDVRRRRADTARREIRPACCRRATNGAQRVGVAR